MSEQVSSPSEGGEVTLDLPQSVCIAIPSYQGQLPVLLASALIELTYSLRSKGIKVAVSFEHENALIDLARNRLVSTYLKQTDYEKIFWIDDDIIFDPDDAERLLAWSTLYPIVAATYPVRQDPPKFFMRRESEKWEQNEYGLFKIIGTGLGFTVMDRSVFDKMAPTTDTFIMEGEEHKAFFKITQENKVYYGEDIYFFKRWHDEFGGHVWLDPSINLGHFGHKTFDYKFLDYLKGLYKSETNLQNNLVNGNDKPDNPKL